MQRSARERQSHLPIDRQQLAQEALGAVGQRLPEGERRGWEDVRGRATTLLYPLCGWSAWSRGTEAGVQTVQEGRGT